MVSAEKSLEAVEKNQNYPILLLTLVDKQETPANIRVAAAVTFKNFVKRNWSVVSITIFFLTYYITILILPQLWNSNYKLYYILLQQIFITSLNVDRY